MGTVLVTDTSSADSVATVAALVAAGHQIARCFPEGESDVPCAFVTSGRCPLDHDEVDVALDVRGNTRDRWYGREQGFVCALRAGIPAVVATNVDRDTPMWWASETVSVAGAAAAVTEALSTIPTAHVARRIAGAVVRAVSLTAPDDDVLAADAFVSGDGQLDLAVNVRHRPSTEVRAAVRAVANRIAHEHWPPLHIGSIVYSIIAPDERAGCAK